MLLRHSTASWKEYFKLNFTKFKRMGGGGERGEGGGIKEKFDDPQKITAAFMSVFASHNVSYVHNVPSLLKNAHYLVDVHIF